MNTYFEIEIFLGTTRIFEDTTLNVASFSRKQQNSCLEMILNCEVNENSFERNYNSVDHLDQDIKS